MKNILSLAGKLQLINETVTGSNAVLVDPGQVADLTYTLPVNYGSAGSVLVSNGLGTLSWESPAIPAGSAGQTLRYDGSGWVANSNISNTGTAVGIGIAGPLNKFDVSGAAAIGAAYAGTATAPENGLLVQGKVSIGGAAVTPDSNLCQH
jgi:hypothetical protein